MQFAISLPADVLWGSFVTHSFLPYVLHPTSGYSEIQFYFEIHPEIAEIQVSGIINRQN